MKYDLLISKFRFDGSSSNSEYKQIFDGKVRTDDSVFTNSPKDAMD